MSPVITFRNPYIHLGLSGQTNTLMDVHIVKMPHKILGFSMKDGPSRHCFDIIDIELNKHSVLQFS